MSKVVFSMKLITFEEQHADFKENTTCYFCKISEVCNVKVTYLCNQ